MLNGTLKYSQDSKVRTQEIGKEIVNSLPFRHQGLAGRIAYNWNYRYFLNFNFGYTGSENLLLVISLVSFPPIRLPGTSPRTFCQKEPEVDEYV